MSLAGEPLDWLERHDFDANVDDLNDTYAFFHPLLRDRTVQAFVWSEDVLRWHVDLLGHAGRSLLEGRMTRSLETHGPLYSSGGRGRIAINDSFRLREEFRQKRIATYTYEAEARLFARWAIREVHLEATDDGRVAWPRLGYQAVYRFVLDEQFEEWSGGQPPPAELSEFPEEFLTSVPCIHMYKVI
jgi:hypothetical protein